MLATKDYDDAEQIIQTVIINQPIVSIMDVALSVLKEVDFSPECFDSVESNKQRV